jgi:hypothetical protein
MAARVGEEAAVKAFQRLLEETRRELAYLYLKHSTVEPNEADVPYQAEAGPHSPAPASGVSPSGRYWAI